MHAGKCSKSVSDIAYDTVLIAPIFFGYDKAMRAELERRGRRVLTFIDRPSESTIVKVLIRINPKLGVPWIVPRDAKIIDEVRKHVSSIKDIIVIKGEAISESFIKKLRRIVPNARFTLYLWDSFGNLPVSTRKKVSLFDRCLSFDPDDCRSDARLIYRPLFYVNEYAEMEEVQRDIDLLFIGSIHTDRFAIISKIARTLPSNVNFYRVMYHPSRKVFRIRRLVSPTLWNIPESAFAFEPMAAHSVAELVKRSKMVLDIERSVQTGFTIRTIEMLGARRKLITTNSAVALADFYRPNNIHIIDRENPNIPLSFFETPFDAIPKETSDYYSISGWIDDILGEAPFSKCEYRPQGAL